MYVMYLEKHGWVKRVGKMGYCSCCFSIYEAKQYDSESHPEIEFAKASNPNLITVCNFKEYTQP